MFIEEIDMNFRVQTVFESNEFFELQNFHSCFALQITTIKTHIPIIGQ